MQKSNQLKKAYELPVKAFQLYFRKPSPVHNGEQIPIQMHIKSPIKQLTEQFTTVLKRSKIPKKHV